MEKKTRKDRAWYNERVSGPGKFAGSPGFVLYFWECVMVGMADRSEDDQTDIVSIVADDIAIFPELEGETGIELFEDDNGFIYWNFLPKPEGGEA